MRLNVTWTVAIVVGAAAIGGFGQQDPDPAATLLRAQKILLADLTRLPSYTCVQTITRRYYRAPAAYPQSCAGLIQKHDKRKGDQPQLGWDRLRLEVAIAEGKIVQSWFRAPRFEENNIEQMAGRGPLGSGDFGFFLDSIFHRAALKFQSESNVKGRRLLEYAYDMPADRSSYLVKTTAGWLRTAYSGTFVVDLQTADIVHLSVRTVELPKTSPVCQAISEVDYGRTMIHDRGVLIPRATLLHTIDREGSESVSLTVYESCREYSSKSRLLLRSPSDAASAAEPATELPSALSPGLSFECRIITPIDSDTAAAGDPIEAVLRSPIHDKKNGVLVPVGAALHGRLSDFEHRSGWLGSFRVSVQWESIEINGRSVPFRAAPEDGNRLVAAIVSSGALSANQRIFVFHKEHLSLHQFDWRWTTLPFEKDEENGSRLPQPGSAVR